MRVIATKSLREFWIRQPDAEQSLKAWFDEAIKARWKTPQDIMRRFATAGFLANRWVVFNLKGHDYRLIVSVADQFEAVYIEFVGTHAEYDAIDATTVGQE